MLREFSKEYTNVVAHVGWRVNNHDDTMLENESQGSCTLCILYHLHNCFLKTIKLHQ